MRLEIIKWKKLIFIALIAIFLPGCSPQANLENDRYGRLDNDLSAVPSVTSEPAIPSRTILNRFPDSASGSGTSSAPTDRNFLITDELLIKLYLIDKYDPGICQGRPVAPDAEVIGASLSNQGPLVKFLRQKYNFSGEVDVYKKIKQLESITLKSAGSRKYEFNLTDGQCCRQIILSGKALIEANLISDELTDKENKSSPC